MNKLQWIILGLGMTILGFYFFNLRGGICIGAESVMTSCLIRRYAFCNSWINIDWFGYDFFNGGVSFK